MQFKTVLMLSGGIDSTAMLHRQLRDTEDLVHVHHINLINRERRALCEKQAVEAISKYLQRNLREFEYSESFFRWDGKHFIGWDIITAMYICALVARDDYVKNKRSGLRYRVAFGDSANDFNAYQWKTPVAQLIFSAASLAHPKEDQQIPQLIQPISQYSKKELIEDLPAELCDLTWSCRTPVIEGSIHKECGRCVSCKELRELGYFRGKSRDVSTVAGSP